MTVTTEQLKDALGTEDFAPLLRQVEALPVAEVIALARVFCGVRATSRRDALKKIVGRHQSVLTFKAKQRATAGRSAA